jgi:hypothetical protein
MLNVLSRPGMNYQKLRAIRHAVLTSLLWFAKVFFKERTDRKFIYNWHHGVICDALQRVADGEIPRLIISCPPGFSKTELVNRVFVPYTIAKHTNPKNLSLSYSADLAWQTSQEVKDVLETELFQALFPQHVRKDSFAKRSWKIHEHR